VHLLKRPRFVLVRADASAAIGAGHVMRCLGLAKAWQRAGGNVTYVMAECIPALEQRLVREGITVRKITAVLGTPGDAEQTIAEAKRLEASWLVADGYRFKPDYVRKIRTAGVRVLFLDDDGRFDFYPADVILNQNVSADRRMYSNREPFTRLLLGPEYILLRPEFIAEPRAREHPAIGRRILVTMGGSDSENVTGRVMLALSRIQLEYEAKIVVGGGNPWHEQLRALADRLGPRMKLERSPENMAPLMRWADAAISGAGSTCWELAYMGVPSIVITLSSDQEGIAKTLAEREIAISVGRHANLSEERITEELVRLLHDCERRRKMSEHGRELVDGGGAARAVKFLQNSL
jgi:UDP-2,4-diacetamido-2,4,6-trideoxy-beta-L-altropyranose hydrolase